MNKFALTVLFVLIPCFVWGNQITVGTIERPPFATQDNNGQWTGFSIDLINEIAERNDINVVFDGQTVFKDMLVDVTNGVSDIAAANISVTSEREKQMDFSQPIYESGLQILIPTDSVETSMFRIIWESGILLFLGGALILLLIVAHLVWFFERNTVNPKHDYFRDDYFGGMWDAFWWAFIVVTMGGFENERPQHYIGRILAVFWVLASLFFVSALTAQITTALTVAELSSGIESYEDLQGLKVGAVSGTTISSFLKEHEIQYIPYDQFDILLNDIEQNKLDAAIGDAAVSQFYVSNTRSKKITLAGDVFARDNIAFAFPEESPYFEIINGTLLEMQHDGAYENIYNTYFE